MNTMSLTMDGVPPYLNLKKKPLSFFLWRKPPMPVDIRSYAGQPLKYAALRMLAAALARQNFQLFKKRTVSENDRTEGLIWPSYAFTMVGLKRLDNLQNCVQSVLVERIPGDL